MVDKSKWYNRALTPPMYEPPWAFYQPEIDDRKWMKPPWYEYHPIHTQIDRNIRFAEAEEKRIDKWKQANRQKTLYGKLIEVPRTMHGNGKPYRGPNWSEEIDEEEPRREVSLPPRKTRYGEWPEASELRPGIRTENAVKVIDYLPFIFFSWREMPRLTIYDRAAAEQPEDGMVLSDEILKGEWD